MSYKTQDYAGHGSGVHDGVRDDSSKVRRPNELVRSYNQFIIDNLIDMNYLCLNESDLFAIEAHLLNNEALMIARILKNNCVYKLVRTDGEGGVL